MSDVHMTLTNVHTHTHSSFSLVEMISARKSWVISVFYNHTTSGISFESMKCVNLSIERIFELFLMGMPWLQPIDSFCVLRCRSVGYVCMYELVPSCHSMAKSRWEMIVLCDEWIVKSEIIPFSLQPNSLIGHAHYFYRQLLCDALDLLQFLL